MSGYHSCILPNESPPSLNTPDENPDTLSESFSVIPITPNTPSDGDNLEIHSTLEEKESPLAVRSNKNTAEFDASNVCTLPNKNIPIVENDDINHKIKHSNITENGRLKESTPLLPHVDNNVHSIDKKCNILSNNLDVLDSSKILKNEEDSLKYNQDNDNMLNSNSNININNRSTNTKSIITESSPSGNKFHEDNKANHKNSRLDFTPKLISTLTLTDDHPLMVLSSPESPPSTGNYPDLVLPPCKILRDDIKHENKSSYNENSHLLNSECSGMMSLSSTEDESFNKSLANGDINSLHSESFSNRCEPQRNTSKNNLYFSDNFGSDGSKSVEVCCSVEDIKKIRAVDEFQTFAIKQKNELRTQPDVIDPGYYINRNVENISNTYNRKCPDLTVERKKIKPDVRAPKINSNNSARNSNEYNNVFGREVYSSSSENQDIPSPDSSTASKPENERSLYQAEIDPFEGCASLKPRAPIPVATAPKKRIKPLLTETDTDSTALSNPTLFASCQNEFSGSASSLDSLSDCSLHSDGPFEDNGTLLSIGCINQNKIVRALDTININDGADCSDTETETEGGLRKRTGNVDGTSSIVEKIPEYSLSEERQDTRRWLKVTLPAGEQRSIDMKVIEPYKRVLSHGGYALSGRRDAIVVFSACYLPDSSRVDYNYVMDNLFLYVLTTLEQLVTDDYILIYLHGSASKRSMPTFHWLKKCYQLIDRRLRKSLKHLYLVHPTFWLKSIMWMTRPFISSKFSRKLSYVYSLDELENLVPVEQAAIPEKVRRYDSMRT